MADWRIYGNVIQKAAGGPWYSSIEEYRWTGANWEYYSKTEDRAPGMMVPFGESDASEEKHMLVAGEGAELLQIYGLTKEDLSIDRVSTTSPKELEEVACRKKRLDV